MSKRLRQYTSSSKAELYIRRHATTWHGVIDVEGMTGVSPTTIRAVVQRLLYINVLETMKEGRTTYFRVKQSYIDNNRHLYE